MTIRKNKVSILTKVLWCITALCMLCGLFFLVRKEKVSAKAEESASKDITGTIGLGDWGVPPTESDIRYLWIRDNNAEIPTAYPYEYWNDHADNKNSNFGVDILEYILIDGESVRSIINANAAGTTSYKASSTFPLSEGGCYAPIALSTLGDGVRFKVMVDYKTSFALTFKAGFTMVNTEGVKLYTTEDVTYNVGVNAGDIVKETACKLSFDGLEETITVVHGKAIGELPAIPEKEGYIGAWTVDGVAINADTVWAYNENKTAVLEYVKTEYALSFDGLEETIFVKPGQAIGELPAISVEEGRVGVWTIDGTLISQNTIWNYKEDKTASSISALEYSELWGIEDRTSWGAHDGEYYFGGVTLDPFGYFNTSTTATWHADTTDPITANMGVDIMKYIYVNGECARDLIVANYKGAQNKNSCSCWLSNPAAWPVYVETTNGSGMMIRLAKAYFGDTVNIVFKAGFSVIRNDNERIYLSNDVEYVYTNGTLTRIQAAKEYTLSFDGLEETMTIVAGQAIGELPAIPEKEGYVGAWKIDGEEITADTVWTYEEDKTAVLEYVKTAYVLTFDGLEEVQNVTLNQAIGELPAIPEEEGAIAWAIDGVEITADTVWTYTEDKTATVLYRLNYSNVLGIEDRAWGACPQGGEYYFGGIALDELGGVSYFNTADRVSGTWHATNDDIIAANGGVDIMQYIYVNGASARDLILANHNGDKLVNNCECWLSNPAASPVYVETTNGSGIIIRLLKSYFGDSFTFTIKAGFSLIANNGNIVYVDEDIEYTYANGVLSKARYALYFESGDVMNVTLGQAIGELPAIPEEEGYVGSWQLDGEEITADTVWTYPTNKTATLYYRRSQFALSFEGLEEVKNVTLNQAIGELPAMSAENGIYVWQIDGVEITADTVWTYEEDKTAVAVLYEGVEIFDVLEIDNWGILEQYPGATYIRIGIERDENGNLFFPTNFSDVHWQDHASESVNNFACDIMEYIFINGKSARTLSTENGMKHTYGGNESDAFPFSLGGIYAPVDVYTNGNEFFLLIMTDYVASEDLVITLKQGFRMATSDGGMVYLAQDFVFPYYMVTFEGGESVRVVGNQTVAEPSEIPTKEETESHVYEFLGWYNGETKFDFNTPITENITLVAKFQEIEKEKFSVTFDADNGEDVITVSVYVGACVKAEQIPVDPTKVGEGFTYSFLYWTLDGSEFDFATTITGDIALTAAYTTKTVYVVTIGEMKKNVAEGEKVEKPADPVKESTAEFDYAFEGWYNGDVKWDFENDVVTSNIELVAKYTETRRKYTVTFNVTGNEAITLAPVVVEYGTVYDLTNLFDGQDLSDYTYVITVNGANAENVTVTGDTVVDVAFTAKAIYKVTINGIVLDVKEGEKLESPAEVPTKESTVEFDFTFDGWYNGDVKWDFENDVVTSDMELVAKFTEVARKYTITFNVTGNDAVKLDPIEVDYGTSYDLTNLFEGVDLSGYTYVTYVKGVYKANVKVVANVTVDVVFTKLDDEETSSSMEDETSSSVEEEIPSSEESESSSSKSGGCFGNINGSVMGVALGTLLLGVAFVAKKKEDKE